MKRIGEKNLSLIPSKHRDAAWVHASKIKVEISCKKCNVPTRMSQAKIHKFYRNGYFCFDCKQSGKKELADALLAIAKRKTEISKRK
jgi:hypothetical protein